MCFGICGEIYEEILKAIGFKLHFHCLTVAEKEKAKNIDQVFHSAEMLQLFLNWLCFYLSEEFLAAQLHVTVSTITKYLKFVLRIFLEEFQYNNSAIFLPERKIWDQKSLIMTDSTEMPVQISMFIDGTFASIENPFVHGKYKIK